MELPFHKKTNGTMTDRHFHKCEFEWKIENFNLSSIQDRDVIRSPIFVSKLLDETGWYIYIVLDGRFDKNNIGVYLRRVRNDKGPSCMKIGFDISLVDMHGKRRCTKSIISNSPKSPYEGHDEFVPREAIYGDNSQLLVKDVLTFKGRIWKYSSSEDSEENVMIRSRLAIEKKYIRFVISPHQHTRNFVLEPESVQCSFKVTFTWDNMEPIFSSDLHFPTITIEPWSELTGWIFMSAKISYMSKDHEDFVTKGVHTFEGECGEVWQLPIFKGSTFSDFDGYYLDQMDFICEFTFSSSEKEDIHDTVFSWTYENYYQTSNPPSGNILANDMKPILEDPLFPDMHIRVGDVRIPAHRFILSARSPVFRRILAEANQKKGGYVSLSSLLSSITLSSNSPDDTDIETKLRKAVQNSGVTATSNSNGELEVVFSNIEENLLRKIVSFLYTDDVEDVEFETAMQLLNASARYQIDGLRKWCESFLKCRITLENACEILLDLNVLGCEVLREAVFLFMYENEDLLRNFLESEAAPNCQDCLGLFSRIKELYLS